MTHIAVAARSADRRRQFAALLDNAEHQIDYAPDVPTLVRRVKSQPIELVVFDLQAPPMDAGEWLAKVAEDQELSWVPVIWVGDDVRDDIKNRIATYRPGLTLAARPSAAALAAAIASLVGQRQPAVPSREKSSGAGSDGFDPQEDTIDRALGIFNDESGGHTTASTPQDDPLLAALAAEEQPDQKPPAESQTAEATVTDERSAKDDWVVSEMTGSVPTIQSDDQLTESAHIDLPGKTGSWESRTADSQQPEQQIESIEDLLVEETDSIPDESSSTAQSPGRENRAAGIPPGGDLPPLFARLADEIATALAKKLATEIAGKIDRDLIRRVIQEQLGGR